MLRPSVTTIAMAASAAWAARGAIVDGAVLCGPSASSASSRAGSGRRCSRPSTDLHPRQLAGLQQPPRRCRRDAQVDREFIDRHRCALFSDSIHPQGRLRHGQPQGGSRKDHYGAATRDRASRERSHRHRNRRRSEAVDLAMGEAAGQAGRHPHRSRRDRGERRRCDRGLGRGGSL